MPKSNNFLNFYIKSSLHVGVAVFALVQISLDQFTYYAFFVFFGTIVGYNFLKYWNWVVSKKVFDKKIIAILSITLVASIACGVLFFLQKSFVQLHLIVALFLVVLYPIIRKTGWIKLFFVAFVVTYVTVYIPLMNHEEVILFCIQRFLILSSLMIPFEILDSTTDSADLKTFPRLFGIHRTKQIGFVLVVLFCITSFYTLYTHYLCFIYALSSVVAIYFSTEKRIGYYTSFWVESLPIFWWLISIVFQ
jgi:hypothetical protein